MNLLFQRPHHLETTGLIIVYHNRYRDWHSQALLPISKPCERMTSCHGWLEGLGHNQSKLFFSHFRLLTFILFFVLVTFYSFVQRKFCVKQNSCLCHPQSDEGLDFLPNKSEIKSQQELCGPAKQIFLQKSGIFLKSCITLAVFLLAS